METGAYKALLMSLVVLSALVPAVAATHNTDHTFTDANDVEWDMCGGGNGSPLNQDGSDKNNDTEEREFPATVLMANPAGRLNAGITQTLFATRSLDQQPTTRNLWEYAQGLDGLVFYVVQRDATTGNGRGWKLGSADGNEIYDVKATTDFLSTTLGPNIDIRIVFYTLSWNDDGDGVLESNEQVTSVAPLGSAGASGTTLQKQITGTLPIGTRAMVVNVNVAPPRDNTVVAPAGSLNIGALRTTTKVTMLLRDPGGDESCQDPVLARCLQDLAVQPAPGNQGNVGNQERDPGTHPTTDPSPGTDDGRSGSTPNSDKTLRCPSVSRLL